VQQELVQLVLKAEETHKDYLADLFRALATYLIDDGIPVDEIEDIFLEKFVVEVAQQILHSLSVCFRGEDQGA
jgi:hypothetical protein